MDYTFLAKLKPNVRRNQSPRLSLRGGRSPTKQSHMLDCFSPASRVFAITNKGQGILEMAFVLIVMVLLLGGILNIWLWGNKQIVMRQARYNQSRVAAGTSSDNYRLQWPVYAPEELNEDEVLLEAP